MRRLPNGFKVIGLPLVALVLVGMIVSGCQTLGQVDIGKQVPPGNSVAIQSGGPYAQTFQTDDMTVRYQYETAGNQLKVWGRTKINHESIDVLTFHLFFLDGQSTVIDKQNFFSFLDHSDFIEFNSSDRQFHRDFKVPPGSKAFAIGYDGNTERTADQAETDFSYYPFGQ
jgi:hypothetical protein